MAHQSRTHVNISVVLKNKVAHLLWRWLGLGEGTGDTRKETVLTPVLQHLVLPSLHFAF